MNESIIADYHSCNSPITSLTRCSTAHGPSTLGQRSIRAPPKRQRQIIVVTVVAFVQTLVSGQGGKNSFARFPIAISGSVRAVLSLDAGIYAAAISCNWRSAESRHIHEISTVSDQCVALYTSKALSQTVTETFDTGHFSNHATAYCPAGSKRDTARVESQRIVQRSRTTYFAAPETRWVLLLFLPCTRKIDVREESTGAGFRGQKRRECLNSWILRKR